MNNKKKLPFTFIRTLAQLKQRATGGAEFAVLLRFGLFSRKFIRYDARRKGFSVFHFIDGTSEWLTSRGLMRSRIGEAMSKGAFATWEK